jgi:hypothetical protein
MNPRIMLRTQNGGNAPKRVAEALNAFPNTEGHIVA